jgi:hypothetical protein
MEVGASAVKEDAGGAFEQLQQMLLVKRSQSCGFPCWCFVPICRDVGTLPPLCWVWSAALLVKHGSALAWRECRTMEVGAAAA